jgi:2-dehydro-3-deoxy-D-arabinonate dehydratase
MKLCRFLLQNQIHVGLLNDSGTITDLHSEGVTQLTELLEREDRVPYLKAVADQKLPELSSANVRLLPPVEHQEVWAVGVTYLRSKKARMEESEFSATAYDKVYDAPRPELFFKALAAKVSGPGEPVGIRSDARWSVPEPELAFVLNSRGEIAGYTVGNDMSSRDIEGENLLYLPQAKIYNRSCALGPCVTIGVTETEVRAWGIRIRIERAGAEVFKGEISTGQLKRRFAEMAEYLFRSQSFPHGAVLLTGTGIVPPDSFTLQPGDTISIGITGIGVLENSVVQV